MVNMTPTNVTYTDREVISVIELGIVAEVNLQKGWEDIRMNALDKIPNIPSSWGMSFFS